MRNGRHNSTTNPKIDNSFKYKTCIHGKNVAEAFQNCKPNDSILNTSGDDVNKNWYENALKCNIVLVRFIVAKSQISLKRKIS